MGIPHLRNLRKLERFILLFLAVGASWIPVVRPNFFSPKYDVLLFDAYGTLLDVNSLSQSTANVTADPTSFVNLWRKKQLDWTWQRSLIGNYQNFRKITEHALEYALRKFNLKLSSSEKLRLVDSWLHLRPFPDVERELPKLARNFKLSVLSNGSPRMLRVAFENAGLSRTVHPLISVNDIKIYKPHPSVYHYGNQVLGIPASRVLFVSSNCWDAIGASAYGFPSAWINRQNDPIDSLGAVPKYIFHDMSQLYSFLQKNG